MNNKKKVLAIIPARSGSKGLKDKNIKIFNGKPMLAYSIEAAIKSNIFEDIIVSTDSEEYALIAKKYGASVPFLRPAELSKDETTSQEVIEYVINELKKKGKNYDYFMILQPTSPLRRSNHIVEAFNLFISKNANSIVSVCETEHSPLYMNTLDSSLSMENFIGKDISTRRQELPKYYRLNGAIYIYIVDYYLKNKNLYQEKSYAYIMEKKYSIDIDDEYDFKIAEYLLKEEKI